MTISVSMDEMSSTESPVRVGIADSNALARAGLQKYIGSFAGLQVVGAAGSRAEAVLLVRTCAMHVLLLEIAMPETTGLELLRELRSAAPALQVVVISDLPEDTVGRLVVRAGAHAYLEKPVRPPRILEAIRSAASTAALAANDPRFEAGSGRF